MANGHRRERPPGRGWACLALTGAFLAAGCGSPDSRIDLDAPLADAGRHLKLNPPRIPVCVEWVEPMESIFEEPTTKPAARRDDETIAEHVWSLVKDALYHRVNRPGFRDLCIVLAQRFRLCRQLAVLEVPYCGHLRFIILAETPDGYTAVTNMNEWHKPRWQAGAIREVAVDPAFAEAWFAQITGKRLPPRVLGSSNGGYWGAALLHYTGAGSGEWHCVLSGPDVFGALAGYRPVGEQASDGELALLPKARGPAWRPKLPDVVFEPAQRRQYERIAARYEAFAAELVKGTAGFPRLADVGGLDGAIRRIRSLQRVEGASFGAEGFRGEFFLLSLAVSGGARRDQLRSMLTDEDVKVRMMALACLARTDAPGRVGLLRSRLRSRDVAWFINGCVGEGMTEGAFASALLHNARFLDLRLPAKPLLPASTLLALDIELLSRDDYVVDGREARRVERAIETGELTLGLKRLGALCPGMSREAILKALGRIEAGERFPWEPDDSPPRAAPQRIRTFLIACLADAELPLPARLAAGSALTRDAHEQAGRALQAHRRSLDRLSGQALGSRLAATYDSNKRLAKLLARLDSRGRGIFEVQEDVATRTPLMLEVLQSDSPGLLDVLRSWVHDIVTQSLGEDAAIFEGEASDAEERRARAQRTAAYRKALLRLAGNLRRYRAPWDTNADMPYALEHFVRCHGDSLLKFLGREQYELLLRNVRSSIAARKRAPRPGG